MLYRLVRSVKRSDSSARQFVQRIPADVRQLAVGRTLVVPLGPLTVCTTISPSMESVRFSLRTSDPGEAKERHARAAAAMETYWNALRRSRPVSLDHEQATALAGDLYRAWAGGKVRTTAVTLMPDGRWVPDSETPGEGRAGLDSILERLDVATDLPDEADLEVTVGPVVDRLLLRRGIASVDAESRLLLLEACAKGLRDAFASRKRNLEGDYSPDPAAARYPQFVARSTEPRPATPAQSSKVSLTGLVEDWWREARATGKKPSTHESYRNTMANLVAFLKHDDASRVTPETIIGFKDHRLATINSRTGKPISAKTVNDSDLSGLKTIFEWAVGNRRLASNPARGLKVKIGKPQKLRSKGFSEDEARAILKAALAYQPGRERPYTAAAKRWVPWLQAYTGARVGEMGQLRKEDLRREGEHWVINITPEAGTVKTNEARDVVLHSHLVELGFVRFVQSAPSGHLFLRPAPSGDVLGPLQALKNRLAEFARETVSDTNVAPTHGWRHRFKTIGRNAGMDWRVLDAIQGQAPESVADTYGDFTVVAKAAAIEMMPRIDVGGGRCLR
jgi:integrase